MKKNIAVISGGNSSEYEISINSGQQIAAHLVDDYNTYLVHIKGKNWTVDGKFPIDKNDFSFTNEKGEKILFDCIYNSIHGTPGEDGKLQGYFDILEIPYTSCGLLTSALTFSKYFCNNYLRGFDIPVAKNMLVRKGDGTTPENVVDTLGLPCFVKPNNSGSSCGVSKVKEISQIETAFEKAFKETDEIIIEQFIEGTELSCGIAKLNGKKLIFPITEIVTQNEFFDYEAKYTSSKSEEITPARISEADTEFCHELTSEIYDILDCKGVVRMDYILNNGKLCFLEVNTVPGMSVNSIIPKQAKYIGYELKDFYSMLISNALNN